jgi:hypothetical protein
VLDVRCLSVLGVDLIAGLDVRLLPGLGVGLIAVLGVELLTGLGVEFFFPLVLLNDNFLVDNFLLLNNLNAAATGTT